MSIRRLQGELEEEVGQKSWPSANEITSSKKDLDVQHDIKYSLQEKKHHLNTVQELLKDSGIKTVIIRNYLPLINQLINQWFYTMNLKFAFVLIISTFIISCATVTENAEETAENPFGFATGDIVVSDIQTEDIRVDN